MINPYQKIYGTVQLGCVGIALGAQNLCHTCSQYRDNGWQLKALFGWTDNDMLSLYTQTVDRHKLARDAIEKLALNSEY